MNTMIPRGEYWITDDNQLIFCDGDLGRESPNHAVIVLKYLWKRLRGSIATNGSDAAKQLLSDIEGDEQACPDVPHLRQQVNDISDQMARNGDISEEAADDIYQWLADEAEIPYEVISYAFEDLSGDTRAFALRKWFWIRVAGKQIVLPNLSRDVQKRLVEGLIELCDREGLRLFEDFEWDVEVIDPPLYKSGISGLLFYDLRSLPSQMTKLEQAGWPLTSH